MVIKEWQSIIYLYLALLFYYMVKVPSISSSRYGQSRKRINVFIYVDRSFVARQNISPRIIAKLQITGNKDSIWRKRSRGNLTRPNFLPPLNVVYDVISAYFSHFLPSLRRGKAKSRVLWRKYFSERAYDCECNRNYII